MHSPISLTKWPNSIPELHGEEIRMFFFPSLEELLKSISLFSREEFRKIPYRIGPLSLIVPFMAIPLFKARGLKFRVIKPTTEANLTQKQRKDLKSSKAFLMKIDGNFFFIKRRPPIWLG